MSKLTMLKESVEKRKPITFEYIKPGKITGIRIGNVHAIFIFTAKSGKQSTKLHIVQTDGVSESKDTSPFPTFRTFNIEDLKVINILEDEEEFEIHKDYRPESDFYKNPIAKV